MRTRLAASGNFIRICGSNSPLPELGAIIMGAKLHAALVVSLTAALHMSTNVAMAGSPPGIRASAEAARYAALSSAAIADTSPLNEINCGVHGQGFFTRTPPPRQRRPATGDGAAASDIPIWRTLRIGAHENMQALRDALRRKRCRIGEIAGEALDQMPVAKNKASVILDLSVLSIAELGFDRKGASFADVYARARMLGLELCPAEVGPQLRLTYMNQPLGEFLHVAMEPIVTRGGSPVVFVLANGGEGLLLISSEGQPDLMLPSTVRFVFVRRQAVAAR
jgi:hypothetical protein